MTTQPLTTEQVLTTPTMINPKQILGRLIERAEYTTAQIVGRFTSADRIWLLAKYIFLQELLRNLGISEVLDVGANTGQFAESLRAIGYAGDILSFEPIPEVFATLRKNMAHDKHWSGHNLALGEKDELKDLNVMQDTVYSSFHAPIDFQEGANRVVSTCSVQVRTLAEILGARSLDATMLKVDTQGHEMQVFRGLGEKLGSVRAIMCELSVAAIYEDSQPMHQVIAYLGEKGFKTAFFAPVGRMNDLSAREFDYFCVRP
jgi:FkbM family methyltransferase